MRSFDVTVNYLGNFEELHKQGSKDFGGAWLSANMAAAEHARSRINVSNLAAKELISLVTLRILMALKQDGWLKEPESK